MKHIKGKLCINYIFALSLFIPVSPALKSQITDKPITSENAAEQEIKQLFGNWTPLSSSLQIKPGFIKINTREFHSLKTASATLEDGQTLVIGAGIYLEPLIIRANNITIEGNGHVILNGSVAEEKAAIVTKGRNITIKNIECKNIKVRWNNGACIRAEGESLYLEHVYFHDSQQGVLSTKNSKIININDSRFENLGWRGRAHGIYNGGGELTITDSIFIAAKDEGHEIKSRGHKTVIKNSIIASLDSKDSRLIDITGGGELTITDSVLQQGPNTSNNSAIGFSLESTRHTNNQITLENNLIILEAGRHNRLLHIRDKLLPKIIATGNIIISKDKNELPGLNDYFNDRKEASLKPYPFIPIPDR